MIEEAGVWKSLLKADATEWLLEENNPSVRCFACRSMFSDEGGMTLSSALYVRSVRLILEE